MNALSLNLAALQKNTRVAGPGVRDALWVQGCSILCPGCANQAFLPHVERVRISIERLAAHFRARIGAIDGCSILGGEPTEQPEAVAALLAEVQSLGLSTVVFSGRTIETLRSDPRCADVLAHTDLLIDGPYIASKRDANLHWRGSSNQRMHRLSDRFSESDLARPIVAGEITIGSDAIVFNGIGTRDLPRSGIAAELSRS